MNKAYNEFYIVKPIERDSNSINNCIYKYSSGIDVTVWCNGSIVELGEIVSENVSEYTISPLGRNTYKTGDIVIYDTSRAIKHFDDGTILFRNDAIISLFNTEDNAPGAGKNEVVIKVLRDNPLDNETITNGFFGEVLDIQCDSEVYKEVDVKIGDKVILVNPYISGTDAADGVFTKVSTSDGFYVVADVDAIACQVEN